MGIKYRQLQSKAWLHARYWDDELSQSAIAELIDPECTRNAVYQAMRRHKIPTRKNGWKWKKSS